MDLTQLWEEMKMGELEERIRELFPDLGLSLDTMLGFLLQGRLHELWTYFWKKGMGNLTISGSGARTLFLSLVLLGIFSAALMRFSDTYEKYQVGELSFYVTYLLQAVILTRNFSRILQMATDAIGRIVQFVQLLMPVYLVSVSMATGSITAGASRQMAMLLLCTVDDVLMKCFLPFTSCAFLLTTIEGVMGQDRMGHLVNLTQKAISVGLKGMLGGIAGMGVLQTILTPAMDRLQGNALMKGISAIPGIGDGVEGVLEMFMGSAMIVKNAAGILMTLLLVFMCVTPLWIIFLLSATLRFAAAVMSIVCDKRLARAADRAGQTGFLLLGITGVAMLFFVICIAVSTASVK